MSYFRSAIRLLGLLLSEMDKKTIVVRSSEADEVVSIFANVVFFFNRISPYSSSMCLLHDCVLSRQYLRA